MLSDWERTVERPLFRVTDLFEQIDDPDIRSRCLSAAAAEQRRRNRNRQCRPPWLTT
jgi:hypothetical protein